METQRKPYFITRMGKRQSFKLHDGFSLTGRPSSGTVLQLYLTEEGEE